MTSLALGWLLVGLLHLVVVYCTPTACRVRANDRSAWRGVVVVTVVAWPIMLAVIAYSALELRQARRRHR